MLRTTAGQVLINSTLPPELRDYSRQLDGKKIEELMQMVADKYPEKYRDVAKKLSDIGRHEAYYSNGFSFGLKDLRVSQGYSKMRGELEKTIDHILDGPGDESAKQSSIIKAIEKVQSSLSDSVYKEALSNNNPLALQVLSGSRGKPSNLSSLIGSDLLYQDHKDRTIPFPVLNNYSEGLTPAEYYAGAFGARKSVVDVKLGTADSGFFSKQLQQAAHRLLVTKMDSDTPYDEANPRGLPVDVEDKESEGALLSQPIAGYKRNEVITPRILSDLKGKGVKRILIRSPIIGGPAEGGLYARDVGVRGQGRLPGLGDMAGIIGAQAIGERVAQGSLNSKHSGGVAGATKNISGFKALNQYLQVPKIFVGGSTHSELDGNVNSITDGPTGGKIIKVGTEEHFVPPGLGLRVKVGDEVEAGDMLSDGMPNPAKIVQHKGIGEGRRYFVRAFGAALKDAGIPHRRRQVEILARGLINHVRLTEETDDNVPGDLVSYDQLDNSWQPRRGHTTEAAKRSVGKYLERPVLHYSVGTRVTKSMLPELEEFGVKNLVVHPEPPPFEPVMVRGLDNLRHDPDWMTRHLGSNLEGGLLDATHRGLTSDPGGTSYVPALANPTNFGRQGLMKPSSGGLL